MKFAEVADNVKRLLEELPSQETFIYELLLAYGSPKATVARLKTGQLNLAKEAGEVLLKKKVWFKNVSQASRLPNVPRASSLPNGAESPQDAGGTEPSDHKQAGRSLYVAIDEMKAAKVTKTNNPRFLIVTNFKQMLAIDRKTGETLDIKFSELETRFDFFIPLTPGLDKHTLPNENPADVRAAEKMAKLFDAIKQDNPDYMREDAHAMNVFLSRLLFCLFAEDTGIFPENAVCNAIASHTADDGSDLDVFFKQLFDWLDTSDAERGINREGSQGTQKQDQVLTTEYTGDTEGQSMRSLRSFAVKFKVLPYVNGGLFSDHFDIPIFSAKSRRMIITSGELNWSEINPDIFGSMFQAVIDPEERHNLGQHYTSVTNIMKVIEPLFLNDFKDELEKARNLSQKNVRTKALQRLLDRIANVKIFDPACGSGNFLIIAYKELRQLEMEVFEALNAFPVSQITVDQFFGIEIDDFACETAILALWLAEHQMNLEYEKRFKQSLTSLPLKDGANIVCANATRIDWETVCPKNDGDEIYVLGNPPYLGSSMQNEEQKADLALLCTGFKNYKNLDYIACWFIKGAEFIAGNNARCAFVSTNSITQGEQVGMLWPFIFNKGLNVGFAHQSFKWTNNAKNSAAVICVIIGLRNSMSNTSILYRDGIAQEVKLINAYLTAGSDVIVSRRVTPIADVPKMDWGSKATDGGNFILSEAEKDELLSKHPEASEFIKNYVGSIEFLRGYKRWCLWVPDERVETARAIPEISRRLNAVYDFRSKSKAASTRDYAVHSNRFRQMAHKDSQSIVIPGVSSERREYVPMGFFDSNTVINNLAFAIYNAEAWIFALLSSRIHMVWMRTTCGRLKTDYRYSSALCYNTFPIPDLTEEQKQTITLHVSEVLNEREKHPEKTMAQLYDPDKMPDGLRTTHHQLDQAVDRLYRSKPFSSDEERLEHLFKLYEVMVAKEQLV